MTAATYERLPVVQRTGAWLDARRDGIGASEAAAALGLSPWESPVGLWARKLGLVPDQDASPVMRIGTHMEPLIAEMYAERTGRRVRRVNQLLRSRVHPWMLASLDRRRDDGVLVEIKWSDRATGYGEAGTDEVPDQVLVQVVHQMAVVDAPAADVALLTGGADLRLYHVARDPGAEAAVIEAERAFWRHVESRTQPPVDGSEETAKALAAIYPRDNGEVLEADEQAAEWLRRLAEHRAWRDEADAAVTDLENRLKAVIGEASGLVAPGIGRVTWSRAKDSQITDWKAVAAELGASADLVARHTTNRTGSRRFLPRWEETHG